MEIVGALNLHRTQITFKWQEMETGEIKRGRIVPVTRESVREWLGQFSGQFKGRDIHLAVEATTGWRFVVEEMQETQITPHLAEPADTSALRGPKRRAKTDGKDCDHMVDLLLTIACRSRGYHPPTSSRCVRWCALRKALVHERREWQQRMQAQLFHQGAPPGIELTTDWGRNQLQGLELSPAGRMVLDYRSGNPRSSRRAAGAPRRTAHLLRQETTRLQGAAEAVRGRPPQHGDDPRRARRLSPLL